MWKSAKVASGVKAPIRMLVPSEATVSRTPEGRRSMLWNCCWYSGATTMRSRAKSATTLIAKATKNG